MKRFVIIMSSMLTIFAIIVNSSIYVDAVIRGCGHDSYTVGAYLDPSSVSHTYSAHPYNMGNGTNGPIYGTCHVRVYQGIRYPQCRICGDVDYSRPQTVHLYTEHENCGLGIIY